MTLRDEAELAAILKGKLRDYKLEKRWEAFDAVSGLVDDIANYCQQRNPRFDRDRFMIGTGIGIV